MIVSKELQDTINAITTLDELENFKSSLEVNETHIDNSKHAIIRLLSSNEYDKYIVNGTCNGSITANNTNAWHFPLMSYKNFFYTGTKQGNWINTSLFPGGYTSSTVTTMSQDVTVAIYSERFADNFNSNSKYKFSLQVGLYDAVYYNPGSYVGSAKVNYQNNDRSKTETQIYSSAQASHNVQGVVHRTKIFYYYVKHTFRPVFQYIDNDKTNNVFH